MKVLNIVIVVLVSLFASLNVASAQTTASLSETVTEDKMISVKVKGITCGNDLKTIAANVEKLEGVSKCKTGKKGATSTFVVTMNPGLVCEDQIYAAIENTGGCKNPNDRPYKVKQ